jgi:single-stranded-DNA-specific exonuclease
MRKFVPVNNDERTVFVRFRWRLPDPRPEGDDVIRNLSQSINVPESIASILVARGITTFDEARDFFRPSLERLHSPYLLKDMKRAVERIRTAIAAGETIGVYGDYDVDGTTSTAMMTLYLRSIGAVVASHTPDRFTEGYGLTIPSLERLFASTEKPVSLLISIDCGITAVDAVAYTQAKGIDVIICDHHEPGDTLPNAFAALNPLIPGCEYPFKHLCGCGVAFKLIQALAETYGETEKAYDYLDFVAMASSADIVSLTDENRIMVHYGLKKINEDPRPGIKALLIGAGQKLGKITTTQIVFGIAPRINAAGRLGDGARSVDLLMASTEEEAQRIAAILEDENINRRKIDEEAFQEACILVDDYLNKEHDRIIVLHNGSWHAGVIGIVASRLVERYHLPVVLMTTVDGVAKGSARSIMGFDIHSALKSCEHMLVTFGGHKYAAGVSIKIDRVLEFRKAMNEVANQTISKEMLTPELTVDTSININELTPRYFAIIRQLAPFGPDNHRPLFHAKDVQVVGYPRTVGKTTSHLKCNIRSKHKLSYQADELRSLALNNVPFTVGGAAIDAIGFGIGGRMDELFSNSGGLKEELEIVFSLDENDYNGKITPQLVLRDFR